MFTRSLPGPSTSRSGARRSPTAAAVAAFAALVLTACGASAERTASSDGSTEGADIPSEVSNALASEGEVTVLDLDFSSATVQALLISRLLEEMGGESTTLKMADHFATWAAVEKDENMVNPEVWDMFFGPQIKEFIDDKKTVASLGTSELSGEEGWYVPTYVIEGDEARGIEPICPGLPDYQALNECAEKFSTSATGDKGRFLTGVAAWVDYYGDQQRIDNLGLDFEVQVAGSEAALVADLKRAYDRGEPWVGLMWRPHYATLRYDMTLVEFPEFTEECWGTTFACGWDSLSFIRIAGTEFEKKHPTAAAFIEGFGLQDEHMGSILTAMEEDGLSAEESVDAWIADNTEVWQQWVPEAQS